MEELKVKVTSEVYIDVEDLDPEFVDIRGFALDEAKRIMALELDLYEFEYEIIDDEEENETNETN